MFPQLPKSSIAHHVDGVFGSLQAMGHIDDRKPLDMAKPHRLGLIIRQPLQAEFDREEQLMPSSGVARRVLRHRQFLQQNRCRISAG